MAILPSDVSPGVWGSLHLLVYARRSRRALVFGKHVVSVSLLMSIPGKLHILISRSGSHSVELWNPNGWTVTGPYGERVCQTQSSESCQG